MSGGCQEQPCYNSTGAKADIKRSQVVESSCESLPIARWPEHWQGKRMRKEMAVEAATRGPGALRTVPGVRRREHHIHRFVWRPHRGIRPGSTRALAPQFRFHSASHATAPEHWCGSNHRVIQLCRSQLYNTSCITPPASLPLSATWPARFQV